MSLKVIILFETLDLKVTKKFKRACSFKLALGCVGMFSYTADTVVSKGFSRAYNQFLCLLLSPFQLFFFLKIAVQMSLNSLLDWLVFMIVILSRPFCLALLYNTLKVMLYFLSD